MGRKKVFENIEIIDIVPEGKGFGRINGKAAFVDNTVPGDIVDVLVTRKKKDFVLGRPLKFHQYASERIPAFCQHFANCGGCKWQDIRYEKQLSYKQSIVAQALSRIGKIDITNIQPIIGCEEIRYYRNKLEYTFSNKRWLTPEEIHSDQNFDNKNGLGFHIAGHFDKVLDIEECYLQEDVSNKIRLTVRQYALENNLSFYDIINQTGLLRNLIVRTSTLKEVMVILVVFEDAEEQIKGLLGHLDTKVPEITSLNYVINGKKNDTIFDLDVINYAGKPYMEETLEHVTFQIGPKSFFQTNSKQTVRLYNIVRKMAGLSGNELVYDLYTGLGSIALFLAKDCKKIVGIEQVEMAIADAKVNAQLNHINNAVFFAGDMKDVLTQDFINQNGKPEVVIVDPPRAGLHEDVVKQIRQTHPDKIVYVSCNPSTQARDIHLMSGEYEIKQIQPVDMFPHTHHVENVMLLERK